MIPNFNPQISDGIFFRNDTNNYTYVNFEFKSTWCNTPSRPLWQIFLAFCDTSKLYSIQNKVNIPYNFNLKRYDQVIISRIRIGHSKLTHTYLLKREQQPECKFCNCGLAFYHIFCSDTFPARNFLLSNIQSIQYRFTKVNINDILQFLQECDFYNKKLKILTYNIYVRRMGRFMVPVSWITTESRFLRAARETS